MSIKPWNRTDRKLKLQAIYTAAMEAADCAETVALQCKAWDTARKTLMDLDQMARTVTVREVSELDEIAKRMESAAAELHGTRPRRNQVPPGDPKDRPVH